MAGLFLLSVLPRTPELPCGHGGYKDGIFAAVVQLPSCVGLFVIPRTVARQASLSFTVSQSLLKLMSIELEVPSNHLILSWPLLLPSIFPSIRVFSNELTLSIRWPKCWSFSISQPVYSGRGVGRKCFKISKHHSLAVLTLPVPQTIKKLSRWRARQCTGKKQSALWSENLFGN